MQHYICTGGCNGVTEKEHATCQATDCPDHGKELHPCSCEDGKHNTQASEDETPSENPANE